MGGPLLITTTVQFGAQTRAIEEVFQKKCHIYTSLLHTPAPPPASISSTLAAHLSAPTMRLLRDWHGNPEHPAKPIHLKDRSATKGFSIFDIFASVFHFPAFLFSFLVLVQDQRKLHLGLNNFPEPGSNKRTFHEIPGNMPDT